MKKLISIYGIDKFLIALIVFGLFMLGRYVIGFEPMVLMILTLIFIDQ